MVLHRAEQVREVVRLGPADNVPDRVHAPALHRARVVRVATAEQVVRRAKVAQRRASPNTAIVHRVHVLLARAARELARAEMVMRRAVAPRAVTTLLLVVRPANVVSGNHMVNAVSASHTGNAVSGNHTASVRVARRVRVQLARAAKDLARAATTIEVPVVMIARFARRLSNVR